MDIRKISPGLSVSPQLLPSEMEEIRARGLISCPMNVELVFRLSLATTRPREFAGS